MELTEKIFSEVKLKAEERYKTIVCVRCPYLGADVHFNAKGLEHLKFKQRDKARLLIDQYARLKILHLAPEIIRLSRTVQGKSSEKTFELERSNGRREKILRDVIFHEFIAIIDNYRVRVIVKQVEDGPYYFWSIIPFWKKDEAKGKRMHFGRPEDD